MKRASIALLLAACAPEGSVGTHAIALRPNNPNELFHYEPGDVIESLASTGGEFRVHYTRAGRHAVPLADMDASGVPDAVERNARLYDELITHYRANGYRDPVSDMGLADNGGDARFDVYLVDFARAADGSFRTEACSGSICAGFMVQENDFVGYGYPSIEAAERTVASHELFHAIQAAYDNDQGAVLSEGTATWAEEHFDPSLSDFERQIRGYFEHSDRSIDVPLPPPVDPFSYGTGIFFQFLAERFDPAVIREIFEGVVDGAGTDPKWKDVLPVLLAARGSSFADAFTEFTSWNLYTGAFASAGYGYTNAARYPRLTATSVVAPVEEADLRVFYASAPVFSISPDGRGELEIALAGADLAGLTLIAAPIRGGRLISPPITGQGSVTIANAEGVLLQIVNTNLSGSSKRPSLCAGTHDEVIACLGRHGGPVTPTDAGVTEPDAAPAPDAAPPPDAAPAEIDAGASIDAGPAPAEASSCAATSPASPFVIFLLAALFLRRQC